MTVIGLSGDWLGWELRYKRHPALTDLSVVVKWLVVKWILGLMTLL